MRIPVVVHDNSSTIKVKPKSQASEVEMKSGCNIEAKVLENKIEKETEERIAADNNLQEQINAKQDKIHFIEIHSDEGYLERDQLNLLISNNLNKIIYEDNYFAMIYKDSYARRYMAPSTNPNVLFTVLVDVRSGHYIYTEIPNAELQSHIENNERHINPGERAFWNRKLNVRIDDELLEFNRN